MIQITAPNDRSEITAMVPSYAAEMAAHGVIPSGAQALADFNAEFNEFWSEPARLAYMIQADGQIAGFSLICQEDVETPPVVTTIAEFFVANDFRRKGVGRAAALASFATHPGPWDLWIGDTNAPAHAFWHSVLNGPAITQHSVRAEEDGQRHRFIATGACQ